MSGTLASLIRQHSLNPKVLYQVPETERESAPGRYDQTGSQKSPAIDRQTEKETAKTKGKDKGFDPTDLDDVDDLGDLQDLIDDRKTDPTGGDPGEDPTDPLNPFLPDPDDPEEPEPEVTPPTPVTGRRVYALHSSTISYSHDGGAHWREYESPIGAIGFAVVGDGVYVATHDGVYYSTNLQSWSELTVAGDGVPIGGFTNGGFESGLSGWNLVTGIEPWTGVVDHIEPTQGDSYLGRDWIVFSDGEFQIKQPVEFSAHETAWLSDGGAIRISADIYTESGATATVGISGYGDVIGIAGPPIPGSWQTSDALDTLVVSGIGGAPAGWGEFRFIYYSRKDSEAAANLAEIRVAVEIEIDGHVYSHAPIVQTNVSPAAGNVRSSAINHEINVFLVSPTAPGSFAVTLPVGWKLPDPGPSHADYPRIWDFTASGPAYLAAPLNPIAELSGSGSSWETHSATTLLPSATKVVVSVRGEGSPADVYIDNMRLELMLPSGGGAEVTAIGKGGGGVQAAINGNLYHLSPTGMRFVRAVPFDVEGIQDGVVFGGGKIIFDGGEPITAPESIAQYLGDRMILTTGGSILQHEDADDLWNELSEVPTGSRVFPAYNGYLAIAEDGAIEASRELSGPWSTAPSQPGSYTGTRGMVSIDGRIFGFIEGNTIVWWVVANIWRAAGSTSAGILDISGR